mmetsp:Transcript_110634/g.312008  ORF Transcript_110634/g.312008 Transcript_110634/m.312008 type:complete len:209 (-) Transcript_110634:166-792(-)
MACSNALIMRPAEGRPRRRQVPVLLLFAALAAALLVAPVPLPWAGGDPTDDLLLATFAHASSAALRPHQQPAALVGAGARPRLLQFGNNGADQRLPESLRANPNEYGMLRPVEKRRPPRKPPFVAPHLLNKITRMNREGIKETIQLWGGSSTIIPAMIGHTIAVHNGRDFIPISITEGMVGYKLKDFAPTHTFKGHPKQQKVTKYRGR